MIQRLTLALVIATPVALLDTGTVRADPPPATSTTGGTSATTASTAAVGTYKVKSGEGLAAIARRLGVKLSDLLAVNGMTITSTIHPGQTLRVPATGSGSTASTQISASTNAYTVKPGDSLAAIARKLGVRLSDLLAVNNITITSTIHPGQTLNAPANSTGNPGNASGSGSSAPAGSGSTETYTGATNDYTVKAGDSLFGIARTHGVSLNSLLAANSFTISSTILPGQKIKVPASQSASRSAGVANTSTPAAASTTSASSPIDTLISYLREQVGKPYKFFTAGPDTFDCSGLVVAGYRQIGRSLPHQSRMQSTVGTEVDFRNEPIQAGDLIFMVSSVDPTRIGHVGIALNSTTWIQAVATGIPVSIKPIPNAERISAVRRIVTG